MTAQVDYFLHLIEQRYGTGAQEVASALAYIREKKEFHKRVTTTGLVSFIGLIVSAILLTVWEGVKAILRGDR